MRLLAGSNFPSGSNQTVPEKVGIFSSALFSVKTLFKSLTLIIAPVLTFKLVDSLVVLSFLFATSESCATALLLDSSLLLTLGASRSVAFVVADEEAILVLSADSWEAGKVTSFTSLIFEESLLILLDSSLSFVGVPSAA